MIEIFCQGSDEKESIPHGIIGNAVTDKIAKEIAHSHYHESLTERGHMCVSFLIVYPDSRQWELIFAGGLGADVWRATRTGPDGENSYIK